MVPSNLGMTTFSSWVGSLHVEIQKTTLVEGRFMALVLKGEQELKIQIWCRQCLLFLCVFAEWK